MQLNNTDLIPTGIIHKIYICYTPSLDSNNNWPIFDSKQEALEHAITIYETTSHPSEIWYHETDEVVFSDNNWTWLDHINSSTLITYHPYTGQIS